MAYYSGDRTGYAKGLSHPRPGLNATSEYQVAGRPWSKTFSLPAAMNSGHGGAEEEAFASELVVDDSAAKIEFPSVAKRLVFNNTSGDVIQVYFCSLMVPSHTGGGAGGSDRDQDNNVLDPSPIARGDALTEAELNNYKDGADDKRPKSAVKEHDHYYVVPNNGTLDINVKCKRVYVTGVGGAKVSLMAELTNIEHNYNCELRGLEGISGGPKGTAWGS